MFTKGTDQALAIDVTGLSALPSVGGTAQLHRKHREKGGGGSSVSYTRTVCLITLDGSLNGLRVLDILNGLGL